MRMLQRGLLACLLVSIGAAAGRAWADDLATPAVDAPGATLFARVATDDQRRPTALQLAIVTYAPRDAGALLEVDLVSAVHIGDRDYYANLNDRFRGYDALLYELILPEDADAPIGKRERHGVLSGTQVAMKEVLGLSFQLDEIEYDRPNFVHADLSSAQLRQSMADRGESLYVYFWRVFYASVNEYTKDPLGLKDWRKLSALLASNGDNALKTSIAYDLTDVDMVSGILDGGSGSAIIEARNQRAVDVLSEQIEAGATRIGIFYGVAHMPDLEERLRTQLGLEPGESTWIDAWRLEPDTVQTDH